MMVAQVTMSQKLKRNFLKVITEMDAIKKNHHTSFKKYKYHSKSYIIFGVPKNPSQSETNTSFWGATHLSGEMIRAASVTNGG